MWSLEKFIFLLTFDEPNFSLRRELEGMYPLFFFLFIATTHHRYYDSRKLMDAQIGINTSRRHSKRPFLSTVEARLN